MLLLDGIPIRFPEWSSVAMHVMLAKVTGQGAILSQLQGDAHHVLYA